MDLLRKYKAVAVNFRNKVESFEKAMNAIPKNKRTVDSRFKCVQEEYISIGNIFTQLISSDPAEVALDDVYKTHNQLIELFDDNEVIYNNYLDAFDETVSQRSMTKINDENLAHLNKQIELSVDKVWVSILLFSYGGCQSSC